MSDATHNDCYLANCRKCGRAVGAVVNNPDHQRAVAEFIEDMTKKGYLIDRVDNERVKSAAWNCECAATEVVELRAEVKRLTYT